MSLLKQIVTSSLQLRNVSPEVLANVDVLISRSVIRLQKDNILPPRTLEFTCVDRKQEDATLGYNYFFLPEDFRVLEEFRPVETYPYIYVADKYKLTEQSDSRKRFTVADNNFDETSPYEKILIATPFPKDEEIVQIRYYVNGRGLDYEWINETYWEAVIADIELMLGLRSQQDVDDHISRAVSQNKESQGNLVRHGGKSLRGSYFGGSKRSVTRTT